MAYVDPLNQEMQFGHLLKMLNLFVVCTSSIDHPNICYHDHSPSSSKKSLQQYCTLKKGQFDERNGYKVKILVYQKPILFLLEALQISKCYI